jgi:Rps23 Pro-64 3,4-dihydroxylase Tpa1-like proline 4-hydroxylase
MQSLDQLEVLFRQLNAVREVAEKKFWLTTDELLLLLEPQIALLDSSGTQVVVPQFQWRNFTCTWQAQQGITHFWLISENQPGQDVIYPVHYLKFDNVLPEDKADRILTYALENQSKYIDSTSADSIKHRQRSRVLISPEVAPLVIEKVKQLLPRIRQEYTLHDFPVARFEAQMTSSNDGSFSQIHSDSNSSRGLSSRVITFLYCVYQRPKAFTGGQLRIYETSISPSKISFTHNYTHIEPLHNSLVIFPSFYQQEVLPISCPSQAFADGLFSVNGWIHKGT